MASNQKPSEFLPLLSAIDEDVYAAGTFTGTYTKTDIAAQYMGVFSAGSILSTGTLDCSLVQATDSSGTGVKVIANATATQLADTDDNKQVIINLKPSDLDIAGGFIYVAPRMTWTTAGGDGGAYLLGVMPFNGNGELDNISTVDEVVN